MSIKICEKEVKENIIPILLNARDIVLYEHEHLKVQEKGKSNYVTDLDIKIQSFIEEKINELYPNIVFVSEEKQITDTVDDYWVLDPIDGTTNLIHGYESSCISLAYVTGGTPVFGCVCNIFEDELFYAVKGEGAFKKNKNGTYRITTSINDIDNSIIGFGFPYDKTKIDLLFSILKKIFPHCDDFKRKGPASLDICYVACGKLDAYIELDLEVWDFSAGMLILQEAGGYLSDFDENIPSGKSNIIACNPILYGSLHEIINDV